MTYTTTKMQDKDPDETEFEPVRRSDYPEDPRKKEYELVTHPDEGRTEINIEFDAGRIQVNATGALDFHTTARLAEVQGHPALDCGVVYPFDDATDVDQDLAIPDDIHSELAELEEEYEEFLKEVDEWMARQPLRLRVEEHEYKTGTWRTKYQQSATVLMPNKRESEMTDGEQRVYEALREEFGGADGYPDVGDENRFEEGEVFDADDLEGGGKEDSTTAEVSGDTEDEHPYAAFLEDRLDEIADTDFDTTDGEETDDACNDDGDKAWFVKTNTSGRQVYGRYSNPDAAVEHARALIDWVDGEYEVDEDPDAHYCEWEAYCEEEEVLVVVDWWVLDDEFRGLTGAGFNSQ